MLSENNHHQWKTSSKSPEVGSTPENKTDTDSDALKASYWAAVAATAHHAFTESAPFQLSLGPNQSKASTRSGFPKTQTSQWLKVSPELFSTQSATHNEARNTSGENSADDLSKRHHFVTGFHSTIDNAKTTQNSQSPLATTDAGTSLPGGQTALEVEQALDMLNPEFSDDDSITAQAHWTSHVVNNPRLVAGIIACCLLSASIYAGLGYWWLTSSNPSHAAEPEKEQAQTQSEESAFPNIKTLQSQSPQGRPNTQVSPKERLIAQAEPVATFAMFDSPGTDMELTGRPDPFSPLIEENESGIASPDKNEDVLTGVNYSGFIGNMNSKDKIAVIKIMDTNPAIAPKTLLKKAGESFYINSERIYIKAVSKAGLTLQVQGGNRTLSLNPYQIVMNNPVTNTNGGNGGSAATGTNTTAGSTTNAAPSSTTGVSASSANSGINIKIEE